MEQVYALLFPLSHWFWWTAAAVMVMLEIAATGVFFLWLGLSAAVVGGPVFFLPDLDWKYQFAVFAVLSVVSVVLSRRYLRRHPVATDRPTLNRRADAHIGREIQLTEPIRDGRGVAQIDGTRWQLAGADAAAGERVRVTGVDGTVLQVEPVGDQSLP